MFISYPTYIPFGRYETSAYLWAMADLGILCWWIPEDLAGQGNVFAQYLLKELLLKSVDVS
jgi:hypothetical protein